MARIATLLIVFAALAWPGVAAADPTVVNVRIEGKTSTLFEGPIVTDGRNVQAVSERATGSIRKCDATNNGANATAGPTPTAAAVDAMSIVGQGFEGRWNDGYEDYFIRGFGPDLDGGGAYWGLQVNGTSISTGGCQRKLAAGDQVLWTYDAFKGRPYLQLPAAPIYLAAGPVTINVSQTGGRTSPPTSITNAAIASDPPAAATAVDASGNSQVTFPSDGWYRLKASGTGFVRSNRALVCVGNCGPQPADTLTRTPPPPVFYGPGGAVLPDSPTLATTTSPVKVSRAAVSSSGYARGRVVLHWRVLQTGVGLKSWTIASDDLSTRARRYVRRATGTTATSASLRLPRGRTYALRFTSTDRLGRSRSTDFGRVVAPIDDRAHAISRRGSWHKVRARRSWLGTLLRGRRGARLKVKLAPGHPTLVLRARGSKAVVRFRSGRSDKRVRVPRGRKGGRLLVKGPRRSKARAVTVSVVRGVIDLDGVAVSP